ncbi:MAG: hypothetical protein IKY91_00545 [Akkermansia sp.]|nr:hypothetical protein [Akkermansia sp.]
MSGRGKDIKLTSITEAPCRTCTTRFYGCHNVKLCKRWAEYVERKRADQKQRNEQKLRAYDHLLHKVRHTGYSEYKK